MLGESVLQPFDWYRRAWALVFLDEANMFSCFTKPVNKWRIRLLVSLACAPVELLCLQDSLRGHHYLSLFSRECSNSPTLSATTFMLIEYLSEGNLILKDIITILRNKVLILDTS